MRLRDVGIRTHSSSAYTIVSNCASTGNVASRNFRLYSIAASVFRLTVFWGIYTLLLNLYLLRPGYGPESVGLANARHRGRDVRCVGVSFGDEEHGYVVLEDDFVVTGYGCRVLTPLRRGIGPISIGAT